MVNNFFLKFLSFRAKTFIFEKAFRNGYNNMLSYVNIILLKVKKKILTIFLLTF